MRDQRKRYTIFLFLVLSVSGALTAQAPSVRFERMEVEKGFPNSVVEVVLQDSRGFLWIGGYAGLHRYDGYEVKSYYSQPGDSLTIGDNKIKKIVEDREGNLWIGAQNGLNYFDRQTETFTRYLKSDRTKGELKSNYIQDLFLEESGRVWIMTVSQVGIFDPEDRSVQLVTFPEEDLGLLFLHSGKNGTIWAGTETGLWKTDQSGRPFERVPLRKEGSEAPGNLSLTDISEDGTGTFWLASQKNLIRYHPEEGPPGRYDLIKELDAYIQFVQYGSDGSIWCGTGKGAYRFHPGTGKLAHFPHDPDEEKSLSGNFVPAITEDPHGNIWLGTSGGVSLFRPSTESFKRYPNSYQYKVPSVVYFRNFLEWSPGKLLMWKDGKLILFDWRTGAEEPFPHQPVRNLNAWNTGVICFFRDDQDRIWMGTGGGVFVFDPATTSFTHYHRGGKMALSGDQIRDIHQDHTGAIWIATWGSGINYIHEETGEVLHFFNERDGTFRNGARTIYEDRSGNIWAGTRGGLLKYDREKEAFTEWYRHDPDDPASMSENTAFAIYEDEEGYLWVGTYGGGLNKMDPQAGTFTHYTNRDGLPDNTVFSILPDDHGNLWLSTYKGIVKFNPKEKTFTNFDHRDGLLNKQYDAFSHYRLPSTGALLYEGKQGIDIFHPDSIQQDPVPPPVRFTDFLIANRSVPIRGQAKTSANGFYLDQSITETKKLVVPYRHKTLTFKFAAPHLSNPEKVRYAYRLEGFDQEWQDIGHQRTATFTNLPPGRYRLSVRAANARGDRNDPAAIDLIIPPPWWRTGSAYGLYVLAIALLFYAYLRYQRRRWQLQTDLEARQREAKRLQELDTIKSQLYANISHEFRTPLTVILGLSGDLPGHFRRREDGPFHRAVEMVRRNGLRVLQLVNQMLDLARLEAGRLNLHFRQGDVVGYLHYLTESYESLAESKSIDLTFTADPPELVMDYDEEKLHQIFTNLLANALKFTPEGGRVEVEISKVETEIGDTLRLEVRDNGPGIPPDKRSHIFDRFYQVDASSSRPGEGTGIGLTLTKELVDLHGGRIEVDSQEERGAHFTVFLPITNEAPPREEGAFSSIPPVSAESSATPRPAEPVVTNDTLPTLLIVEDAPDIITYLESCLQGRYDIRTAANGRLGLEAAREIVPDIILSDVMMPEMDGFELCETLKTDERTSHIPVVLLTARATVQDRLAGLQRGADAYLPKPFHKEELLIRLEKLVELRRKLQERYAGGAPLPPTDDPALRQEDEFVQKVRQAIEARLDDDTFGPNELVAAVHLSRTQVHRKLKALTGESTGRFIRNLRLDRAMAMFKGGATSVQEVAYAVGFSDPAYFTRVFGERFGGPPRGFVG